MKTEDYLCQLREVERSIYENMGNVSQITIDIVQETILQLDKYDDEDEVIERDELGALNYDISILLKVFNPKLKFDIATLKKFDEIIKNWYNDVEFVNITLGILRKKG
jgi:hypothetical protein